MNDNERWSQLNKVETGSSQTRYVLQAWCCGGIGVWKRLVVLGWFLYEKS
jgi:hypothetical protein